MGPCTGSCRGGPAPPRSTARPPQFCRGRASAGAPAAAAPCSTCASSRPAAGRERRQGAWHRGLERSSLVVAAGGDPGSSCASQTGTRGLDPSRTSSTCTCTAPAAPVLAAHPLLQAARQHAHDLPIVFWVKGGVGDLVHHRAVGACGGSAGEGRRGAYVGAHALPAAQCPPPHALPAAQCPPRASRCELSQGTTDTQAHRCPRLHGLATATCPAAARRRLCRASLCHPSASARPHPAALTPGLCIGGLLHLQLKISQIQGVLFDLKKQFLGCRTTIGWQRQRRHRPLFPPRPPALEISALVRWLAGSAPHLLGGRLVDAPPVHLLELVHGCRQSLAGGGRLFVGGRRLPPVPPLPDRVWHCRSLCHSPMSSNEMW